MRKMKHGSKKEGCPRRPMGARNQSSALAFHRESGTVKPEGFNGATL